VLLISSEIGSDYVMRYQFFFGKFGNTTEFIEQMLFLRKYITNDF